MKWCPIYLRLACMAICMLPTSVFSLNVFNTKKENDGAQKRSKTLPSSPMLAPSNSPPQAPKPTRQFDPSGISSMHAQPMPLHSTSGACSAGAKRTDQTPRSIPLMSEVGSRRRSDGKTDTSAIYAPHSRTVGTSRPSIIPHAGANSAPLSYVPHAGTIGGDITYTPGASGNQTSFGGATANVSRATNAVTSNATTTYTPHAKATTATATSSRVPKAGHDATVAAPVFGGSPNGSGAPSCGGYALQTIGNGRSGTVCRCVYGGLNDVGWWAVQPGSGSTNSAQCGPPGSIVDATPSAAPSLAPPSITTYIPQAASASVPTASMQPASQPVSLALAPAQNTLQPSYIHIRDVVQDDTFGAADRHGQAPKLYEVSVTNTGQTKLYCTAGAKALTYNQNATCAGVGDSGCANLTSWYTDHGSAYVQPDGKSRVVGIRYYSGQGSYSVNCKTSE